jgi:hypothetical protein
MTTATLSLTPWAHQALSLDEMADLGRRLVELHARAHAGQSGKGWTIRVDSWAQDARYNPVHQVAHHHQIGHLADLIHVAINEYERRFVFTPDELVQIQRQGHAA